MVLQEFAQGHVPSDFEYLQGSRLHGLTGWPVPESVLLQLPSFQEKCFLLHLNGIFYISVPVISICPVTRHHWGHLLYFTSSNIYTHGQDSSESSLLKDEYVSQFLLICQVLQHLTHHCGPLLDSLQHVHVSALLRSPEWTQLSWRYLPELDGGEEPPPLICWHC